MSKITCLEALARVYEYLDGELEGASADAIRKHLEVCQACYPELNFARVFRDALRRAAQGQPCAPAELRRRVAELIRAEDPGSGA